MKVTAQTATGNEISVHDNQGNDPSVHTKVHLAKLRRESMARDKSKLARFGTGSRKLIRVGVPGGKKACALSFCANVSSGARLCHC